MLKQPLGCRFESYTGRQGRFTALKVKTANMDFRSIKLPPVFSCFSSKCKMSPSKGEYLGQFIIPSRKKIICGLVASGI